MNKMREEKVLDEWTEKLDEGLEEILRKKVD